MTQDKKISINIKSSTINKVSDEYPIEAPYPNNILIEVTNACNLKCSICYHPKMKRKIGYMSDDMYEKIIDEVAEMGIENLGLYTTGEAFLHPKIFDFIKQAKDKGIPYVYITTNGLLINKKKIEQVFASGLDSVKISIDAGSKEKYEEMKIGGNWDVLVDNIKALKQLRDEKNSKLRIFASYVVVQDDFDDLKKYKEMFDCLVDETINTLVSNQAHMDNIESVYKSKLESKFNYLVLPQEKWHPCGYLWNRFMTTYDGKLTICCNDFEARLIYGDLNQSSLKECWNNEKMKSFRKIHKEKKFQELPLCDICDFVMKDFDTEMKILKQIEDL
ncbi:MAG: radical SAM protein [Candidatus Omnitrophica bacterium]|nr:radical SAM protein [Candidatus Omnitrophota bacterium]